MSVNLVGYPMHSVTVVRINCQISDLVISSILYFFTENNYR